MTARAALTTIEIIEEEGLVERAAVLGAHAMDRMREFLEAGFTAVQSAGGAPPVQGELQRRINEGLLDGPRIVVATFAQLAAPAPGGGGGGRGGDPARTATAPPGFRSTATAPAIPEEEVRAFVREAVAAGVEAIKAVIIVTPGGPEAETLARPRFSTLAYSGARNINRLPPRSAVIG